MGFWHNRKVLVSGGTGFIGSHVVESLAALGAKLRVVGRRPSEQWHPNPRICTSVEYLQGDLANPLFSLRACQAQEVILHLAAVVGGIGYNFPHPATLFYENVFPGLQFLKAAQEAQVEKVLLVSSACVYPREAKIPTPEEEGFLNEPEEGNLGYGWGKRTLEVYSKLLAREFNMPVVIVRPYNAYGPRDNFSLTTSHVIPALFKKAYAPGSELVVWGDGTATRSFVYVEDIVRGLLLAVERGPVADPINLGTEEEVSIAEVARLVLNVCGVKKTIRFDTSKPGGQPRRTCDTKKAASLLGFRTETPLSEGLKLTANWLQKHPEAMGHSSS